MTLLLYLITERAPLLALLLAMICDTTIIVTVIATARCGGHV